MLMRSERAVEGWRRSGSGSGTTNQQLFVLAFYLVGTTQLGSHCHREWPMQSQLGLLPAGHVAS